MSDKKIDIVDAIVCEINIQTIMKLIEKYRLPNVGDIIDGTLLAEI